MNDSEKATQTVKKTRKNDFILINSLFILFLLMYLAYKIFIALPAVTVQVTVNNKLVAELDLNKDQELTIQEDDSSYNHLEIKDGKIWVDDASCPDKVCITKGKIEYATETIVCAPNKMVITIMGN